MGEEEINTNLDNTSDDVTDNSNDIENTEPDSDNSDDVQDKKEPETKEDDAPKSKFSSIEEATKSYSELEKKLGQQSNELGDLRKVKEAYDKMQEEKQAQELQQAQQRGFNNVDDFRNNQAEVEYVVNEYAKHINEVDFPDEMKSLLEQYKANPSTELLDTIEAEFPLNTVKKVASGSEIFKGQLQAQQQEALRTQVEDSLRTYLNETVPKYKEEFENEGFRELFGEAFKAYGVNTDAEKLVSIAQKIADCAIKSNGFKRTIADENKQATDEIAGLTNSASKKSNSPVNLTELNEEELDKVLERLL